MNSNDIKFNDDLEFYTSLNVSKDEVCVALSDDLEVSEQVLPEEYKFKIAEFINNSEVWYQKVFDDISKWVKEEYNEELKINDIELVYIFILFEPNEPDLYGLQFRLEFDIEHGCGLKVSKDNYNVIEIGSADVAFC